MLTALIVVQTQVMLDHVSLSNDVLMQDKTAYQRVHTDMRTDMCHLLSCAEACGFMGVLLGLPLPVTPLVTQHGQYTELRAAVFICRKSTSHTRFGFLALFW